MSIPIDLPSLFEAQRAARWRVAATSVRERQARLGRLLKALMARRTEVHAALAADFGKCPEEVDLTELYPVVTEIKAALAPLPRWMRPRQVPPPPGLFGSAGSILHEPKGLVLIISPWNYPINLTLGPLVSALAAGNCAILKPSELTPHTSAFLKDLVEGLFPREEVAVMEGEAETSRQLLQLPFDHVFFTGSPAVGKVVMRAAAEHLASVTLELGGKSPVLVDADADLREAARKIAWGKFTNAGQTCVAPDYALVHEAVHDALVEALGEAVRSFYGPTPEAWRRSPDYARIVNVRHHARIADLLRSSGGRVVFGGDMDAEDRYIAPTVVTGVPPEAPLLQEEIFGPVLPILKVRDLEEAVRFVNLRPRPLALYVFAGRRGRAEGLVRRTTAGGACIHDTVLHYAQPGLPFGGVGVSGVGKAHGIHGFEAFSNARGLLRQRTRFSAMQWMYPPYTPRVRRLVEWTLKYF